jgi:hypothetical protein
LCFANIPVKTTDQGRRADWFLGLWTPVQIQTLEPWKTVKPSLHFKKVQPQNFTAFTAGPGNCFPVEKSQANQQKNWREEGSPGLVREEEGRTSPL